MATIDTSVEFAWQARSEEPTIVAMEGYDVRVLDGFTATYRTPNLTPKPGNVQVAILCAVREAEVPCSARLYVDWMSTNNTVIAPLQLDACTPADYALYTSADSSVVPILIHTPPPRYQIRVEFQATGAGSGQAKLYLTVVTGGSIGTVRS